MTTPAMNVPGAQAKAPAVFTAAVLQFVWSSLPRGDQERCVQR